MREESGNKDRARVQEEKQSQIVISLPLPPIFEHLSRKKADPKNLMSREEILDSGNSNAQLCT